MLGNRAHEGLQPPSNLEERKGLKEAQHAAHPHPPQIRGVISVSLEGSHRDPRPRPVSSPRSRVASLPLGRRIVSASLECSEPTLEQGESSPSRSRPPLDEKDKRLFRSPARRTEALNANHSSTAPRSDGVRPPFPTVAVIGVPSANSGHCSAIPGVVAILWKPATRYESRLMPTHFYPYVA